MFSSKGNTVTSQDNKYSCHISSTYWWHMPELPHACFTPTGTQVLTP